MWASIPSISFRATTTGSRCAAATFTSFKSSIRPSPWAARQSAERAQRAQLHASLAYGDDNRIVLTGQYFNIWGTSDPILYAGLASGLSPNSKA